jgi:hypothetical protein
MNYCEEKGINTSKLNEAQRTLYFIAENMKMTKSISEEGYEHFQQAIKALEPKSKTGYWIEHSNEWGDNWQYSQYECSCCHNWAHFDTDYCPNCGTEMEEVKE